MEELKKYIRDVPDFPKEGVIFKDITPLLDDAEQFQKMVNIFRDRYEDMNIDVVVGIEARGFIFGAALAYALKAGLVIVRKPGKLPWKTFHKTYSLEYGTDTLEIHQDAIKPGQRVLMMDDVLATGGTLSAAVDLVENNFDAEIVEIAFLIELDFLNGRQKLNNHPIYAMMHFRLGKYCCGRGFFLMGEAPGRLCQFQPARRSAPSFEENSFSQSAQTEGFISFNQTNNSRASSRFFLRI